MPKCNFNKVAKHFGMGVLLWICCKFSEQGFFFLIPTYFVGIKNKTIVISKNSAKCSLKQLWNRITVCLEKIRIVCSKQPSGIGQNLKSFSLIVRTLVISFLIEFLVITKQSLEWQTNNIFLENRKTLIIF